MNNEESEERKSSPIFLSIEINYPYFSLGVLLVGLGVCFGGNFWLLFVLFRFISSGGSVLQEK